LRRWIKRSFPPRHNDEKRGTTIKTPYERSRVTIADERGTYAIRLLGDCSSSVEPRLFDFARHDWFTAENLDRAIIGNLEPRLSRIPNPLEPRT